MYEEVKIHSIDVISKVYKINDTAYLNKIMETWQKEKQWFLEKWKGPIKKICSNYSGSLSKNELTDLLNHSKQKILYKINENITLREQIYNYLDQILVEDFFGNLTSKDYVIENVHIPRGIKVGKSIKLFFDQYYGSDITEKSKENLSKIQMIMSTAQQKNKICGDLYLSVHPLDFLTMSTNNHKWTSCHAINHAYSAGNFAYIQDSATCVAYLVTPGKERVQLEKLPEGCLWNDKSWRMLFFLSEDRKFAASGRHYPYEIPNLEETIVAKLVPCYPSWIGGSRPFHRAHFYDRLCGPQGENGPTCYFSEGKRQVEINYQLYSLKDVISLNSERLSEEPRFYCDILHSNSYTPNFYYNDFCNDPIIKIGKNGCGCLCCGKDANCQSYGLPFCEDCFNDLDKTTISDEWWTCCSCGFQAHDDECKKIVDKYGSVYCSECYREEEDED